MKCRPRPSPPTVWRRRAVLRSLAIVVGTGAAVARGAGPVFWDYPEGVSFLACDLAGAGLDEFGRLVPGLAIEPIPLEGPEVVWRLCADGDGGAWLGSGHDGRLWQAPREGAPRLVATLPEPELFTVARAGADIYAGGGPDGLVFRVAKDGSFEPWADLPHGYVWDLVSAPDGALYAATGTPAAIWRLEGRQQATLLCELGATHAMDLALLPSGRLLAVTQGPGLIWDIDPRAPRDRRLLWEAQQDELRRLAGGPDGAWYALAIAQPRETDQPLVVTPGPVTAEPPAGAVTPPRDERDGSRRRGDRTQAPALTVSLPPAPTGAVLYRIGADGTVTTHWSGDAAVVAVAHHPTWGWLAAGALDRARGLGAVFALDPPSSARPLATWEGGEAIDLLAIPDAGRDDPLAWVALARPGRALRLYGRTATAAAAVSPPIDGGATIRWARLHWEGAVADGIRVRLSARCGPRATPDATWSAWSEAWEERDHAIPLPPARFLQWRVEFTGTAPDACVAAVAVSGREPNTAPRIQRLELQPPGDLTPSGLFGEGGSVTESFSSGLRAEYTLDSRRDRRVDPLTASRLRALRTFVWQAADPNQDRLLYRLAYRAMDEQAWLPIGEQTPELLRTWDTAGVPDGWYVVRLVASDELDNAPGEDLRDERASAPLLVDNTPPEIADFAVILTREGVRVTARARDRTSPLAEAWIELPDGRTLRLDPRDGVCDSVQEDFDVTIVCPGPGRIALDRPWRLRAGFVDRAGNVGRAEGEAR